MGHSFLGTFGKAPYKVDLLAPAPASNELAETLNIQVDVGGQCGAGPTGGSGGVNPDWTTTIELLRRKGTDAWEIHLESTNTHKTPNAKCSAAVEGHVIGLNISGHSESEFNLPFGEHVIEFSCFGQNPSNGCYGHAGGVSDRYEQLNYSGTIHAKPANPPQYSFHS